MAIRLKASDLKKLSGKPKPPRQKETDLVRTILAWLKLKGILCWRNNTGAVKGSYKGKSRFVRFGVKGGADIFGVLPGGRFLAIEVKVGKNVLSNEQADFIGDVCKAGGFAMAAWTLEEVEYHLFELLRRVL